MNLIIIGCILTLASSANSEAQQSSQYVARTTNNNLVQKTFNIGDQGGGLYDNRQSRQYSSSQRYGNNNQYNTQLSNQVSPVSYSNRNQLFNNNPVFYSQNQRYGNSNQKYNNQRYKNQFSNQNQRLNQFNNQNQRISQFSTAFNQEKQNLNLQNQRFNQFNSQNQQPNYYNPQNQRFSQFNQQNQRFNQFNQQGQRFNQFNQQGQRFNQFNQQSQRFNPFSSAFNQRNLNLNQQNQLSHYSQQNRGFSQQPVTYSLNNRQGREFQDNELQQSRRDQEGRFILLCSATVVAEYDACQLKCQALSAFLENKCLLEAWANRNDACWTGAPSMICPA